MSKLENRPSGLLRTITGNFANHGIILNSGMLGTNYRVNMPWVFPEGLSSASGEYLKIPQQTFLGASIRSFNMNGGFGDSSSTLSVDLINDEYNHSDGTTQGLGDDVYHSGNGDRFIPPMAGSPVFFKFGPERATVEQAYTLTFSKLYGTTPPSRPIGSGHIVFGGILQSYVENRGPGGSPLYSVQVVDPREILSNCTLILNNYTGSVYNTKNIFNIYGFLEQNITPQLSLELQSGFGTPNFLVKKIETNGMISYSGSVGSQYPLDCFTAKSPYFTSSFGPIYKSFPITGTGFSRRGPNGIPYYRVAQGINALLSRNYGYGSLPDEYKNRGFGSSLNFRGYNYVIDFGTLPSLPPLYCLDFDQINLLDLALEICDVANRDLFVSLLPVINHPACADIYNYNNQQPASGMIHGIIRLDAIDRSQAPQYGAIKTFIDSLGSGINPIYVQNQDIGFELSNVVTDKVIVGAQEVDTHFFSANGDRDIIDARSKDVSNNYKQWLLEEQLKQQILPYYGLLGNKAISIPKGWGSYQQILLDSSTLNAKGVGQYYVATEMELRCASVSYECWVNFLKQYNDTYLESLEEDDSFQGTALQATANYGGVPASPISQKYGVTVPRSVFHTYATVPFNNVGLPTSACNPPYGYPLYYKRMTQLGLPEAGLTQLSSRITSCIEGAAAIANSTADTYKQILNNQLQEYQYISEEYGTLTQAEIDYFAAVSGSLNRDRPDVVLLNDISFSLHKIGAALPRLAKKGTENGLKVYSFLKSIADENLGKKFLVKIPTRVNFKYTYPVVGNMNIYTSGPFGFMPRSPNALVPSRSDAFMSTYSNQNHPGSTSESNFIKKFLASGAANPNYIGALRSSFNPISDQYEFNYTPTNVGGFFPFDLLANIYDSGSLPSPLPSGVMNGLIPQDLTNFLNENGRISPYVRFDNSQYLSFTDFNKEDFTQQIVQAYHMIPDLCELLDNTGSEQVDFSNYNANRPDNQILPKAVAFVKCTVDEKFYMPPKIISSGLKVYGYCGSNDKRAKVSRPRKIFIPCSGLKDGRLVPGTGVYVDSFRYIEYQFYPTTTPDGDATRYIYNQKSSPILNSNMVDTEELDLDNVYALITLPNKVVPTKDARYRDGLNQTQNTYSVKHYLTVDVVKNLPEFNLPYANRPKAGNIMGEFRGSCDRFITAETASIAWLASKQAKQGLKFGLHNTMQLIAPSPVYPDLVALPLISHERSYGPWISSQINPQAASISNIGGRVEFIQDENLSPWNYAGYDLMNFAGRSQAQFANSLLLFSERGGFTYPGIPKHSLCTALLDGGPLVTNISVDVSDGGYSTTYKMDLYTANFGKLHKQKQDLISKISRERQKLRDERNALIRKGIGKAQSNFSGNNNLLNNPNGVLPSRNPYSPNYIVASVTPAKSLAYAPSLSSSPSIMNDYIYTASMQNESDVFDNADSFDGERDRQNAYYNAGAASMDEMYMPFSHDPHHENMPNIKYSDFAATYRLYASEDFIVNDDDLTYPA